MKNILICISTLNIGGAEKQAIEDANMLCEDFKVYMLTFQDGPMRDLLDKKVKLFVIPKTGYLDAVRKLNTIISENNIDLLHAHLYAPMVLSALAGQLKGKPVIWNFHSHAFENSLKAKWLHKFTARLTSVKKILFPAKELIQYYENEGYGFSNNKLQVAFNSGQQRQETGTEPSNLKEEKLSIGYIGRLVELKRVDYLVELAEYLTGNGLSNFSIDIVGDGPELTQLTKTVEDKKLDGCITFHGFQSNTLAFFSRFDIFTLPSREEVLSLSLIDAGLSGLPAVAFRVGGNGDIIIDGETGFLVDTKEQFFSRVTELVKNPELRARVGEDAKRECYRKFSPEARKTYLLNLYALYI